MKTLYQDGLVQLTDQEIIFHRYYFPFGNDRRVPLAQIEQILSRAPSLMGGSWRIWGTGDFQTWFPLDGGRPGRDRIFFASLRNSSRRIGFTVEDSQKFDSALKELGLMSGDSGERKSAAAVAVAQVTAGSKRSGRAMPIILLILLMAGYATLVPASANLLPERVAMHFGATGHADHWTGRHEAIVFFEMMTVLPAVFLLLSVLTGIMPAGSVNLPHRERWLAPDQRARTVAWISTQIAWLGCLNVFFLAGIYWLTIRANRMEPARLPMDLFLALLAVYLAAMIAWTICFYRHFAKRTG